VIESQALTQFHHNEAVAVAVSTSSEPRAAFEALERHVPKVCAVVGNARSCAGQWTPCNARHDATSRYASV